MPIVSIRNTFGHSLYCSPKCVLTTPLKSFNLAIPYYELIFKHHQGLSSPSITWIYLGYSDTIQAGPTVASSFTIPIPIKYRDDLP